MRPFGVLLITGRLEGGGCNEDGSRVCVMGEDDIGVGNGICGI